MKKFFSGVLTATLVFGLAISALAASGNISFNLSAIKFNGEVISEAGEGYALSNGCVAPASITYTDEKGGGTTYLPARRVSELLGVDIGWDPASGAVTIGKTEQPVTPDTTANAPDYSDWSAEDEAAYQEFKGMWEIEIEDNSARIVGLISAHYTGTLPIQECVDWMKARTSFASRLMVENSNQEKAQTFCRFYYEDTVIASCSMLGSKIEYIEVYDIDS